MSDQPYPYVHEAMVYGLVDPEKVKCALLKHTYEPSFVEKTSKDILKHEIDPGNGYKAGGKFVEKYKAQLNVNTKSVVHTCDDVVWKAKGGGIGPARWGVFYDSESNVPVFLFDFGVEKIADDGTEFIVGPKDKGLFSVA